MDPHAPMTTLMRYVIAVLTVGHRRESFLADPAGDLAAQGLADVSGDDVLDAVEGLRDRLPAAEAARFDAYLTERRLPAADPDNGASDGDQSRFGAATELSELTAGFEVDELDRSVVEQALGAHADLETMDYRDDLVDPVEDFGAGAPVAAEDSRQQGDAVADPAGGPGTSDSAPTEDVARSDIGSDDVPARAVAEEGGVLGDGPASPLGERWIDYDDAPREVAPEPEPAPPEPEPPPHGDPRTPPWGGGGTKNLPGKTNPLDKYGPQRDFWDDAWGESPFEDSKPWDWLPDEPELGVPIDPDSTPPEETM